MVELKERSTEGNAPTRRATPAAGCFGYVQPNRKPASCEVSDPSIFAALFTKSL
jgi:hypothetical protein